MKGDQFEEAMEQNQGAPTQQMSTFTGLAEQFEQSFHKRHFPAEPAALYDASQYLLTVKGKRIRPVMCLMGNELFDSINPDAWHVAAAIELFHHFTLIHDDIMDRAPLRRNRPTVHVEFGNSTALLAGDVMLVAAYESINRISADTIRPILHLFNSTAKKVCEGQQLDMEFETAPAVSFADYERMITLKTSVLLAASLQMGAALGGAGMGNQQHLYEFGKNLGIAFQVQDDYLDAFGDPEKFGKKSGGDIVANKKTFLLIGTLDTCSAAQQRELMEVLAGERDETEKVRKVTAIYKACGVDQWAKKLKQQYLSRALSSLEEVAVLSSRKKPLEGLAHYLLDREH